MMDRESVIERLPTHRELRELGMTLKRRAAEHSIRCVLNAIRADHREPDAWEAHDIVRAIGLLFGVRTYSKLNAKMFLPFHKFGLYRTVRNMHVNYFFAELIGGRVGHKECFYTPIFTSPYWLFSPEFQTLQDG